SFTEHFGCALHQSVGGMLGSTTPDETDVQCLANAFSRALIDHQQVRSLSRGDATTVPEAEASGRSRRGRGKCLHRREFGAHEHLESVGNTRTMYQPAEVWGSH